MVTGRFWLVTHEVGNLGEEFHHGLMNRGIDDHFISGFPHKFHPSIAFCDADFKRHVATPKAWMSPLNEIPLIGSKSEKKKVAETLLGAFPVIVWIHQADELIFPHFFIKFGSQLSEAFFS